MKINLKFGTKKEPVQTGLRVSTLVRAGRCGCVPNPDASWQCNDGKGNDKKVWRSEDIISWRSENCKGI